MKHIRLFIAAALLLLCGILLPGIVIPAETELPKAPLVTSAEEIQEARKEPVNTPAAPVEEVPSEPPEPAKPVSSTPKVEDTYFDTAAFLGVMLGICLMPAIGLF